MADKNAFDLFQGLSALGRKDRDWFNNLSPEGQKAAAPFVMMRWMSGTSDSAQIVRLNTVANPYMFAGSADKSALFKLLATAATGKVGRVSWIKGPTTKAKRLSIDCISQYYDCSPREAATYKVQPNDLIEMSEELGWDKEETAKLKKELDDGSGTTAKTSSKPSKPARGKRP